MARSTARSTARSVADELAILRAGGGEAVHRFTREFGPTLLGWCIRLGGPTVDPVPMARAVLDQALGELDRAPRQLPMRTWLFGLVRAAVQETERPARWWQRAKGKSEAPGARERIRETLQHLPLDDRAALVLVDFESMRLESAAILLGVPVGEVARRLSVARAAFADASRAEGLTREALGLSR
jgi:DNA-directed RNA polymerase specialized sigma24 family protein